ncbi:MAG: hypothetical protein L3K08_07875 [Thermoplasmata archaeon]|nr:hypothetical protein [Thermoplasmata archaeon]
MFAYTGGLFVGVVLAIAYLLFLSSMAGGFVLAGLVEVAVLIGGTETAQWLLLRSVYFGTGTAGPFYALGFRAGIAGILILATVAQYLAGSTIALLGLVLVLVQGAAILTLEVGGALLSLRASGGSGRVGGGPVSGAIVGGVGFYFIGIGLFLGTIPGIIAAAAVAAGMAAVYRRLRDPILARVKPPPEKVTEEATDPVSTFGRTDR